MASYLSNWRAVKHTHPIYPLANEGVTHARIAIVGHSNVKLCATTFSNCLCWSASVTTDVIFPADPSAFRSWQPTAAYIKGQSLAVPKA